jgi:hypothetical protein
VFDIWFDAARKSAAAIGVRYETLEAAHGLVRGALGMAWIEHQAALTSKPDRGMPDVHPLYRSLTGGSGPDLLTVAELAAYLMRFRDDPGMKEIITSLKPADKFESTFFELRMAWCFICSGCTVSFYPPTPSGVGDLRVTFEGQPFLVEVSAFEHDLLKSERMKMMSLGMRTLSLISKRVGLTAKCVIEVDVTTITDGNFQQDVRRAIADGIRSFKNAYPTTVSANYPFGTISVRIPSGDERPGKDHSWDMTAALLLIPRPEYGTMHGIQYDPRQEEASTIHMNYPANSLDPYERIGRKLRDELRQLSGSTEPRLVILDVSGLQRGILKDDDASMASIVRWQSNGHTKISGLWPLTRVYCEGRWVYRGPQFAGVDAEIPLGTELHRRVVSLDKKNDPLGVLRDFFEN